MVNLNSRGCKHPGCRLTPNFGLRGAGAVSCAKHKDAGMVNLVSKRCEADSCDRIPSYNWDAPGARAVFCNTHKAEGGRDGRTAGISHARHPNWPTPSGPLDIIDRCRTGCSALKRYGFWSGMPSLIGLCLGTTL